ncbi:hypothetical protein KIPB_012921, partial [Kipferlia bialata]
EVKAIVYAVCHPDGVVAIAVTDRNYPKTAVFRGLTKILEEFTTRPPAGWHNMDRDSSVFSLDSWTEKFKNPAEIDNLYAIQVR